jgi:hypothetical protein
MDCGEVVLMQTTFLTEQIRISNSMNDIMTYSATPPQHKEEVVTFHNHDAHWSADVMSSPDETFDDVRTSDSSIGNFLQRPLLISSFQWTVSTGTFLQTINPWSLFLENDTVVKKLDNFRLLRSNLCVKITINGNGFYYGRAIASYLPRHNEDLLTVIGPETVSSASMRPHVFLDPGTSEGGSMKLPFFNPNNWIDLSAGDARDMGEITIQHINVLKHANSTTGSVAINVFAWLENPVLAIPTRQIYDDILPQSGSERELNIKPQAGMVSGMMMANQAFKDEYGMGIVSKMSSTVASAAGMLNNVPVIGRFAKATQSTMGKIGQVAHIFGFSRPAVVTAARYFKPAPVGNLVNTDQEDTVTKLSLDSKQELTLDPRTVGLSDVDEMAWKYIVQREMYYVSFNWPGASSANTLLWNSALTARTFVSAPNSRIQLAPFAHAAVPFRFWRGTLIFRFQIVASAHHKGRLRISYEPTVHLSGDPLNVQFNRIVDIAEERDFEVALSWAQPRPWLEVDRANPPIQSNLLLTQTNANRDRWNGVVAVYVVNDLTSPNPVVSPDVSVNVYIRAGDDFECAGPGAVSLGFMDNLSLHPQSGMEPNDTAKAADTDSKPQEVSQLEQIGENLSNDHIYDVYMGERVVSFRQLLKRYNAHVSWKISTDLAGVDGRWRFLEHNYPIQRGHNGNYSRHERSGPAPHNFAAYTLFHHISSCYAGWRGALRSKYLLTGSDNDATTFSVERWQPTAPNSLVQIVVNKGTMSDDQQARDFVLQGSHYSGKHITHTQQLGAMEVEFPYYCRRRFSPARNYATTSPSDILLKNGLYETHAVEVDGPLTGDIRASRYVSVGEDFSCFFYLGPPLLYTYSVPAARP